MRTQCQEDRSLERGVEKKKNLTNEIHLVLIISAHQQEVSLLTSQSER